LCFGFVACSLCSWFALVLILMNFWWFTNLLMMVLRLGKYVPKNSWIYRATHHSHQGTVTSLFYQKDVRVSCSFTNKNPTLILGITTLLQAKESSCNTNNPQSIPSPRNRTISFTRTHIALWKTLMKHANYSMNDFSLLSSVCFRLSYFCYLLSYEHYQDGWEAVRI